MRTVVLDYAALYSTFHYNLLALCSINFASKSDDTLSSTEPHKVNFFLYHWNLTEEKAIRHKDDDKKQ